MRRILTVFALLAFAATLSSLRAADISIDPAVLEQLQRIEPLTPDKIGIFVQAGRLTDEQADYIKHNLDAQGHFAPKAGAAPAPAPAPAAPPPAPAPQPEPPPPAQPRQPAPPPPATQPRAPAARAPTPQDPYANFGYTLPASEQEHLRGLIREFRHGDRSAIGRELRKARPQVNALIAQAYNDPIDMMIKIELWEEVAGPANPDGAIGMFETHRSIYETGRLVLIPYEKDVGGVQVRRRIVGPEGNEGPPERFFTSREIRDAIEKLEGLIARCSSPSSAIFLADVYAKRYGEGEAPMRDKSRDRHRMVEACGGNPKKFDEDEAKTFSSSLSQHDRALIAEALIPHLHAPNDDLRKIAKNGLQICLPRGHPKWDDGRGAWERYWEANKAALLSEK